MLNKQLGRRSVIAAVAAFGLILSVVSTGTQAQAATKTTIAIAYDLGGRSQPGFNQLAYIGVKPLLAKNKNLALIEAQAALRPLYPSIAHRPGSDGDGSTPANRLCPRSQRISLRRRPSAPRTPGNQLC